MAVVDIARVPFDKSSETYQVLGLNAAKQSGKSVELYLWEQMGNGDTGQPLLILNEVMEISFHFVVQSGTLSSGTVTGSNNPTDGYVDLADHTGTAIDFTASGVAGLTPYMLYVRPETAGTSPDVDVYAVVRYK
jgi:hypothetical protein